MIIPYLRHFVGLFTYPLYLTGIDLNQLSYLSRCYTLKRLSETDVQRRCEASLSRRERCNI